MTRRRKKELSRIRASRRRHRKSIMRSNRALAHMRAEVERDRYMSRLPKPDPAKDSVLRAAIRSLFRVGGG